MPAVRIDKLRQAAIDRLTRAGALPAIAAAAVDHMLTADRWGRATHGLSVRFAAILKQVEAGAGRRFAAIVADSGAYVTVDGQGSVGYAAGTQCADLLAERALEHGLAAVALRRTGHTGMIGYYTDRIARIGVVALGFAHCRPMMAPAGGAAPLLGSNPVSMAFPAQPQPILVDTGTAAVSYGSVLVARKEGRQLPPDSALDAGGRATRDPEAAAAGCLVPFGGHRGGALAVAIQLLAGAVTGASVIPPAGQDYGLLLIGLQRGLFAAPESYDAAVAEFAERYREVPARPGHQVRLPGSRRVAGDSTWTGDTVAGNQAPGNLEISVELAGLLKL